MPSKRDPVERFNEKVQRTDGCWLWTGSFNPHCYGKFKLRSYVQVQAHRFAYELAYGPIPKGLFVCHHCDNPKCVRPDHLFLGTAKDNVHDMLRKGRHPIAAAWPVQKPPRKQGPRTARRGVTLKHTHQTHCLRGHPLQGENIRYVGTKRVCKACDRMRNREYYHRHHPNVSGARRGGRPRIQRAFDPKRGQHKTHCKWGHEFNEENTFVSSKGTRYCRTCVRARSAVTREKQRAKKGAARSVAA